MSAITAGGFAGYSIPRDSVQRPSTPVHTHLRMTKRGRAVLLSIIATPVVLAALAFGINAGGAVGTSSSTPLTKITVVGGETLWGVAKQIAPGSDPRDVISDIMSVNRLNTADIYPGERLAIPAQYNH